MIERVQRQSMKIIPSGRSSDFISPSFGHGCLLECSYCYMKRHKPTGLTIAQNTKDILKAIDNHVDSLGPKTPNQTHEKYWTYDISCNEDFLLHMKYHDWYTIFEYFRDKETAFATLTTKKISIANLTELKKFGPKEKIRIRFSLMPQGLRNVLEPKASTIDTMLQMTNFLLAYGYEIHFNFSPVILTSKFVQNYTKLFEEIDEKIKDSLKSRIKSEVIFLTHNENKHNYNLASKSALAIRGENLLYVPHLQEEKRSKNGEINLRYKRKYKKYAIEKFKELHNKIIPWNTIRYIF